jgi:hypothetical protein
LPMYLAISFHDDSTADSSGRFISSFLAIKRL